MNIAGLFELWIAMQSTICGKQAIAQDAVDKFTQTHNIDDLGLNHKQKYDLGLLVHVLYNNPKVGQPRVRIRFGGFGCG